VQRGHVDANSGRIADKGAGTAHRTAGSPAAGTRRPAKGLRLQERDQGPRLLLSPTPRGTKRQEPAHQAGDAGIHSGKAAAKKAAQAGAAGNRAGTEADRTASEKRAAGQTVPQSERKNGLKQI